MYKTIIVAWDVIINGASSFFMACIGADHKHALHVCPGKSRALRVYTIYICYASILFAQVLMLCRDQPIRKGKVWALTFFSYSS